MEFELDRTQMSGFAALVDTTIQSEETLEMIVPDACPDIQRIVETDGKVFLCRKEVVDGKVEVAGIIRAAVLYLPDGEDGMRHLDVSIPFACAVECADAAPNSAIVSIARLCRADTRAVNPRKVLVRAEAAVDITVFAPQSQSICTQVIDAGEKNVEQLIETREVYFTACVQEKPFSISDGVNLSSSKPGAVELLKSRVCLSCGESKIIGNKLIFKGSANVELFYRGEDNGIYSTKGELPFSQIMEVSGVAEEAENDLSLALSGAELALDPDNDGRSVTINLEVMAQVVVRESRALQILTDAYCTKEPVEAEWEHSPVEVKLDRGIRSQSVREVWETPDPVRELMDCRVSVIRVVRSWEGERLILTAEGEVQILYITEEGGVFSFRQPVRVPCSLDLPEGCQCFCQCEDVGDVYAAPAAGGSEVRFTLDFRYSALSRQQLTALADLCPGKAEENTGEQPSLVLRMLEQGERLWDVAKLYGTTIADIVSVNELSDELAGAGRLLLIPRKR